MESPTFIPFNKYSQKGVPWSSGDQCLLEPQVSASTSQALNTGDELTKPTLSTYQPLSQPLTVM